MNQTFLDFVVPPFVPPLDRTSSRTKFGIVSIEGAEEGVRTTMGVDSIAAKVATKTI